MAQRRDQSIVERLREMAIQTNDAQLALQGLWAHYATVGLDESLACNCSIIPIRTSGFGP